MLFNELVGHVVEITARPDKLAVIRRAVNSVARLTCGAHDFARDLNELILPVSSSEYIQSIGLSELPSFRKISYIRPVDSRCLLEALTSPLQAIEGGRNRTNCFYVAGQNLVVSLRSLTPELRVGYYAYPPVFVDDSSSHWLLDSAPYLLIEGAAARVFRNIGDEESARQHEADYRIQLDTLLNDSLYGVKV